MPHPLPLTGERTLPGVPGEEYWFARHEAVYRWIASTYADRLRGAVVVEAGSGEGYGAQLLRGAGARLVLALEYDPGAVGHSGASYPAVSSVRANLADLPVAPASVDVLVCLQVVEHLWDLRGFLRDCAHVMTPGGLVVVSTPNRPVFSPGLARAERPANPFHVEEFDAEQLEERLAHAGLVDVEVLGLRHAARIHAWEDDHEAALVAAQIEASTPGRELDVLVARFVAGVTVDDFEVGDADGAQDLVAVAVAP